MLIPVLGVIGAAFLAFIVGFYTGVEWMARSMIKKHFPEDKETTKSSPYQSGGVQIGGHVLPPEGTDTLHWEGMTPSLELPICHRCLRRQIWCQDCNGKV